MTACTVVLAAELAGLGPIRCIRGRGASGAGRAARSNAEEARAVPRRYRDYLPPTESLAAQARASNHGGQHGRIKDLKASLAAAVVSSLGLARSSPPPPPPHRRRAPSWPTRRGTPEVRGVGVSRRPRPGMLLPLGRGGRFPASVLTNIVDSSLLQRPLSQRVPRRAVDPRRSRGWAWSPASDRGHHVGQRRRRPQRRRASGAVELAIAPPLVVRPPGRRAAPGHDEQRHAAAPSRASRPPASRPPTSARSVPTPARRCARTPLRVQGDAVERLQLRHRRLRAARRARERGQPQGGDLRPHLRRRPGDRAEMNSDRRRGRPLRPLHELRPQLLRGVLLGERERDRGR